MEHVVLLCPLHGLVRRRLSLFRGDFFAGSWGYVGERRFVALEHL
jgi:hypothetical protein